MNFKIIDRIDTPHLYYLSLSLEPDRKSFDLLTQWMSISEKYKKTKNKKKNLFCLLGFKYK